MVWWSMLITVAAFGAANSIGDVDYQLRILHMNDLHSRFQPVTKRGSDCKQAVKKLAQNSKNCLGGIARIKYFTDDILRNEKGNTIFVNAGDVFQVDIFFNPFTATFHYLNTQPRFFKGQESCDKNEGENKQLILIEVMSFNAFFAQDSLIYEEQLIKQHFLTICQNVFLN